MFHWWLVQIFISRHVNCFGISHQMVIVGIFSKKLIIVKRFVMFHVQRGENTRKTRRVGLSWFVFVLVSWARRENNNWQLKTRMFTVRNVSDADWLFFLLFFSLFFPLSDGGTAPSRPRRTCPFIVVRLAFLFSLDILAQCHCWPIEIKNTFRGRERKNFISFNEKRFKPYSIYVELSMTPRVRVCTNCCFFQKKKKLATRRKENCEFFLFLRLNLAIARCKHERSRLFMMD